MSFRDLGNVPFARPGGRLRYVRNGKQFYRRAGELMVMRNGEKSSYVQHHSVTDPDMQAVVEKLQRARGIFPRDDAATQQFRVGQGVFIPGLRTQADQG